MKISQENQDPNYSGEDLSKGFQKISFQPKIFLKILSSIYHDRLFQLFFLEICVMLSYANFALKLRKKLSNSRLHAKFCCIGMIAVTRVKN